MSQLRLMPKHRAVVSSEGYRPCVTSLPSLPSLAPDRLLSTINCSELVSVVSAPGFALFAGLFFFFSLLLFFGMSYSLYLLSSQECKSWLRCVLLAFLPVILSLPMPVTPKRAVDRFQIVSREGLFHLWESDAVQSLPFPRSSLAP